MSSAERKAVIKHADMNEEMQQDAIDCANVALEKFNIEKDIAAYIKKEFDKKYNPTWHCVVGRNFGSYVTHETKHFIYFYMGQVAVLLFKSGWKTWSQSSSDIHSPHIIPPPHLLSPHQQLKNDLNHKGRLQYVTFIDNMCWFDNLNFEKWNFDLKRFLIASQQE
mgnify:CR=1 FL=1